MSLRVREERLSVENHLGENALQAVFQGTVELSPTGAEIARVVWVQGYPVVTELMVDEDRVQLQGVIDISMVYVPEVLEGETAELEHVEWPGAIPFDHYVEIVGAEPYMVPQADLQVLGCEWHVRPDQRVIDVDVITQTTAQVTTKQEYTVLTSATIDPPKKLAIDDLALHTKVPFLEVPLRREVSGIIELPDETEKISKLLDVQCDLVLTAPELSQGKVKVQGTTCLDVIYATPDGNVRRLSLEDQLPFDFEHQDATLTPQMEVAPQLALDWDQFVVNDGGAIRIELVLTGKIMVFQSNQTRVLLDVENPNEESIESRKETIYVDSLVNEKTHQGIAQGVIELSETQPPIREILRTVGRPLVSDYRIDEDKVIIDGTVDVEIIYLAYTEEETRPLYMASFPNALSFQQTVVLSGVGPGMKGKVGVSTKDIKPDLINRETIEIAATLKAEVVISEYIEADVVVEAIEMSEPDPSPPSITYLFVQEKDTLWKLARQYHTSEEELLQANSWLQERPEFTLQAGDKLCIPRK